MDPNERLTCEQLLEHPYFDKRFMEGFDLNQADQQIRRQREKRDRDRRERERNASRQTVPTVSYMPACLSQQLHKAAAKPLHLFSLCTDSVRYLVNEFLFVRCICFVFVA